MSQSTWIHPQNNAMPSHELIEAAGGYLIVAQLLEKRGFNTPESIERFLNTLDYPPFKAMDFPDMPLAVERVKTAITEQEAILVYGDFDVDGVCGTSILMDTLIELGANVSFYIPSRHDEGHGLNTAALLKLVSSRQIKLVITTDTGTSNFNEINLLKGLGVETIVTDHHELPENMPLALAVLNPMILEEGHPARGYSGSGMSFLFSSALLEAYGKPNDAITDIYAIGTIVDMVSLKEDNRYWVKKGLAQIATRQRVGLAAILKEANVSDEQPITTTTVGFTLGPRINAIGRLTKADDAVKLLTTKDPEEAKALASQLEQYNRQRQQMVEKTTIEAMQQLEHTGAVDGQKVLMLASKTWNPGIVGLVATRLVEQYERPAMMGCIDSNSGLVKFSARSLPGVHLTELIKPLSDVFANWGGHSQAAGFALKIEDYAQFKVEAQNYFNLAIKDESLTIPVNIDLELSFEQITLGLIEQLEQMTPFGVENPEPIFMVKKVRLAAQRFMGEGQKHLKFVLQPEDPSTNKFLEAVYWGWPAPGQNLPSNKLYDIAFKLSVNLYQGETRLQLVIEDIKEHNALGSVIIPQAPSAKPLLKNIEQSPQQKTNGKTPFKLTDLRNNPQEAQKLMLSWSENNCGQIFCEGLQQQLPIPITPSRLCNRNLSNLNSPEPLMLWDIPASMETLMSLLKKAQSPELVFSLGKYQTSPSNIEPEVMLKGMRNLLLKQYRENDMQPLTIEVGQLSQWMSTTDELVLSGLSVFQNLDWFEVFPETETTFTLSASENPQTIELPQLIQRMDFQAFNKQHQQVMAFRQWWLNSELTVLESHIGAAFNLHVA